MEIEELKSIIDVISKNKIKQLEVINNSRGNSNLHKLYEGISQSTIQTDEQIAQIFFSSTIHSKYYSSRLKTKLKERLINTLFLIDTNEPSFNDYNKAYYNCYKLIAAYKILINRAARKAAIPLAEQALKVAVEFELIDIVFIAAHELRIHYATFEGEKSKFEEYDAIAERYQLLLIAEAKAERHYSDIRMYFAKSKAANLDVISKVDKYVEELRQVVKQQTSYKLNYFYYLLLTMRYEIAFDYENFLKASKEALEYFESRDQIVPLATMFSFSLRIMVGYIRLKEYKSADLIASKCLSFTKEGSGNWFLALDYQMILAFHVPNFQEAYKTYQRAINHIEFKRQYKFISEHWRVHEAYVFYLLSMKKIEPDNNNPLKTFRINKFLNEVPLYSKDKRGTNISIIILQILFLLQQQKYGDIIDRMESLKAYTQRYLRQDDTFRSNCFIQMLLTLPDCSFHKKAVLRKSEKYWKKLQEVPLDVANQSAEIELVPYEMLWEFVLESLDEKWH